MRTLKTLCRKHPYRLYFALATLLTILLFPVPALAEGTR